MRGLTAQCGLAVVIVRADFANQLPDRGTLGDLTNRDHEGGFVGGYKFGPSFSQQESAEHVADLVLHGRHEPIESDAIDFAGGRRLSDSDTHRGPLGGAPSMSFCRVDASDVAKPAGSRCS